MSLPNFLSAISQDTAGDSICHSEPVCSLSRVKTLLGDQKINRKNIIYDLYNFLLSLRACFSNNVYFLVEGFNMLFISEVARFFIGELKARMT
jgi:hypothetical protein